MNGQFTEIYMINGDHNHIRSVVLYNSLPNAYHWPIFSPSIHHYKHFKVKIFSTQIPSDVLPSFIESRIDFRILSVRDFR